MKMTHIPISIHQACSDGDIRPEWIEWKRPKRKRIPYRKKHSSKNQYSIKDFNVFHFLYIWIYTPNKKYLVICIGLVLHTDKVFVIYLTNLCHYDQMNWLLSLFITLYFQTSTETTRNKTEVKRCRSKGTDFTSVLLNRNTERTTENVVIFAFIFPLFFQRGES